MAYIFPQPASAPQTPQYFQNVEKPRLINPHAPKRHGMPLAGHKGVAILVAFLTLASIWLMIPFPSGAKHSDNVPFSHGSIDDYFSHFEGRQDCGIASTDLYIQPKTPITEGMTSITPPYCRNRAVLLSALSFGGRHGFNAPFYPLGCQYRWYSTEETCMILDRFQAVAFIGDGSLRRIYAGFNMLLRENLAMGGLEQWRMKEEERKACRCDSQVRGTECMKYTIVNSQDVRDNDSMSRHSSPYYCDRTPHIFLHLEAPFPPAPEPHIFTLSDLLAAGPPNSQKVLPIIHSLSTSPSSIPSLTSLDEFLLLADTIAPMRPTPFLWIGPSAINHPQQNSSQAEDGGSDEDRWHFTADMKREVYGRGVDALAMWNFTAQTSPDFGIGRSVVQAMMVVNWLARLETV